MCDDSWINLWLIRLERILFCCRFSFDNISCVGLSIWLKENAYEAFFFGVDKTKRCNKFLFTKHGHIATTIPTCWSHILKEANKSAIVRFVCSIKICARFQLWFHIKINVSNEHELRRQKVVFWKYSNSIGGAAMPTMISIVWMWAEGGGRGERRVPLLDRSSIPNVNGEDSFCLGFAVCTWLCGGLGSGERIFQPLKLGCWKKMFVYALARLMYVQIYRLDLAHSAGTLNSCITLDAVSSFSVENRAHRACEHCPNEQIIAVASFAW